MIKRMTFIARNDKLTPVKDRTHPFEQLVEVRRHAGAGHKHGKVVVA